MWLGGGTNDISTHMPVGQNMSRSSVMWRERPAILYSRLKLLFTTEVFCLWMNKSVWMKSYKQQNKTRIRCVRSRRKSLEVIKQITRNQISLGRHLREEWKSIYTDSERNTQRQVESENKTPITNQWFYMNPYDSTEMQQPANRLWGTQIIIVQFP